MIPSLLRFHKQSLGALAETSDTYIVRFRDQIVSQILNARVVQQINCVDIGFSANGVEAEWEVTLSKVMTGFWTGLNGVDLIKYCGGGGLEEEIRPTVSYLRPLTFQ